MLVKKGYQRMLILHRLYSFKIDVSDLVTIYILYIRSILEFSCQVWHFDITEEESSDLERVQKVALKIILQEDYTTYEDALECLNLDTLRRRREKLCLNFAAKCVWHPKAKEMFPINSVYVLTNREREFFYVQHASTSRLRDSTIPQLQRALNLDLKR